MKGILLETSIALILSAFIGLIGGTVAGVGALFVLFITNGITHIHATRIVPSYLRPRETGGVDHLWNRDSHNPYDPTSRLYGLGYYGNGLP